MLDDLGFVCEFKRDRLSGVAQWYSLAQLADDFDYWIGYSNLDSRARDSDPWFGNGLWHSRRTRVIYGYPVVKLRAQLAKRRGRRRRRALLALLTG